MPLPNDQGPIVFKDGCSRSMYPTRLAGGDRPSPQSLIDSILGS